MDDRLKWSCQGDELTIPGTEPIVLSAGWLTRKIVDAHNAAIAIAREGWYSTEQMREALRSGLTLCLVQENKESVIAVTLERLTAPKPPAERVTVVPINDLFLITPVSATESSAEFCKKINKNMITAWDRGYAAGLRQELKEGGDAR